MDIKEKTDVGCKIDQTVIKINRLWQLLEKAPAHWWSRITLWNFWWTVPLRFYRAQKLSSLFDRLDELLPGEIRIQAANLSSGQLYILGHSVAYLLSYRRKNKETYLAWSAARHNQEIIAQEIAIQARMQPPSQE